MEAKNEKTGQAPLPMPHWEGCLFAQTPAGNTIGVVTAAEPSSLTLLAAGIAGMAERRARRERRQSTTRLAG